MFNRIMFRMKYVADGSQEGMEWWSDMGETLKRSAAISHSFGVNWIEDEVGERYKASGYVGGVKHYELERMDLNWISRADHL